jgi:hypothetical protein
MSNTGLNPITHDDAFLTSHAERVGVSMTATYQANAARGGHS